MGPLLRQWIFSLYLLNLLARQEISFSVASYLQCCHDNAKNENSRKTQETVPINSPLHQQHHKHLYSTLEVFKHFSQLKDETTCATVFFSLSPHLFEIKRQSFSQGIPILKKTDITYKNSNERVRNTPS